jgi:hypothetical protein
MSNKRYDQFGAVTPTTSRITLHADPSTGALGKCTLGDILGLQTPAISFSNWFNGMGESIKYAIFNLPPIALTTGITATSGYQYNYAIYLPAGTYTGFWFALQTKGVYTASSYNGAGLYSTGSTGITLIASTTDDGNLWKANTNTITYKAFSSPITVAAGSYYLSFLHRSSAITTEPVFFEVLNTVASYLIVPTSKPGLASWLPNANIASLYTTYAYGNMTAYPYNLPLVGIY